MTIYEFTLRIRLPHDEPDPEAWLDRLFEAGCDDATIGTGRQGFAALVFAREAPSAAKAVATAIRDVRRAMPRARIVAAEPDLVNLADLARLMGFTRQNMRKYVLGQVRTVRAAFPAPAISGPESYWRLAEVGIWMAAHAAARVQPGLVEIACETSRVNLRAQQARLRQVLRQHRHPPRRPRAPAAA
jgi:hypothetical protein